MPTLESDSSCGVRSRPIGIFFSGIGGTTASMQDWRPYGIYVVEDSPVLLPRLLDVFNSIPGALVVGHSGRADTALAEIGERKPNAVILDLKLETGSGYDVLLGIVHLQLVPTAIVLTNYTTALYRTEATRLGAAYFFDKSSEIPQAVRVVIELIQKYQETYSEDSNDSGSKREGDDYGRNGRRSR
jgi:DNA-binding NarL/FixJ family response regulator